MGKIAYEKRISAYMIGLYCRKNHGDKELCNSCLRLKNYAFERLTKCQFGDNKMACKDCKAHCYKPDMRAEIRTVMRYAGPRMMFYYPIDFVKHLIKK